MSSSPSVRRATVWAALPLIIALLVTLLSPTPPARAGERNLVIFGDSVPADPPLESYGHELLGLLSTGLSAGGQERASCVRSPESFGVLAAQELGLTAHDFSCAGSAATSPGLLSLGLSFARQVDLALAADALGPQTERVLITVGFNDTYTNVGLTETQLREEFVAAALPQVDRIKAAAPEARVQIVGYGSITEDGHVCLVHLGNNSHDRTRTRLVTGLEGVSQRMQQDLAGAADIEFIDLKPTTADNSTCAPDEQRMWAGLIDRQAGPNNLPVHANARGHAHIAEIIVAS